MKIKSHINFKRFIIILLAIILSYLIFNAYGIYNYSKEYSEEKCDVAIVLGAGTSNGKISPIFKERINHSIYLYNNKIIKMIILTGGYGSKQKQSDSKIAKNYLLTKNIPVDAILIEEKSRYTIENLIESKQIMDSLKFNSALIVTDPIHMKRSMKLAEELNINCKPSPTKTTMYRTFLPKTKSLAYETFYYSLGQIIRVN